MISALRNPSAWLRHIVHARSAQTALFGFAFLEALLLPIPIEAVLAPFMQMRRDILWWIATVALAGFLTASMLGYGIGAFFYDEVGDPIIRSLGWQDEYAEAAEFLEARGFWAILAIGITPVPTQIVMIGAGALAMPIYLFLPAVVLARGLRCFGIGLLVYVYGDRVVDYFTRRRHAGRHPKPHAEPHTTR